MSVLDIFRPRRRTQAVTQDVEISRYSLAEYLQQLQAQGPYALGYTGGYTRVEDIENGFVSYIQHAYKASGVVFACMLARQLIFSEARFQWQDMTGSRPGNLFGNPELSILERPWPNGTTGELLARMIQDVDLAGNFYAVRDGNRLRRLRPDWVSIILSAPPAVAVRSNVVGYRYSPGGVRAGQERQADDEVFLPNEIVHWSPIPDPEAQYRGMSWLTPVLREIQADKAATTHKLKFFENGATLQVVLTPKTPMTKQQFLQMNEEFAAEHSGADNAYKTTAAGGADVTVVGADMRQLDFKSTQGAGETRIAAAARIHPVIVGLSEGMQGSSLNAGNFSAARRIVADGTMRPLWRSACAALESVLDLPSGGPARLWFDDRDIAFLREDQKDAAEIQQIKATAIRALVDAGFEPQSVVASVEADDRTLLKHSGLYSVQLQEPGAADRPAQPSVEQSRSWNPTLHPRDSEGQFADVPGVGDVVDAVVGAMRLATSTDREDFRRRTGKAIPPAWTDVYIADDLDTAKLLVKGRDAKGRVQSIYSAAHTEGQAAKKFARIRELNKHLDKLDHAIERDARDNDDAAALLLIRRLGMRPGSERDTRANAQAHGATNLRARHVRVDDDGTTHLDFVGKKGVHIQLRTDDPLIADVMRRRLASRSGDDRLFSTTENRTRDYMRSTGVPSGFLLKDLRTVRANVLALQEVAKRGESAPRTKAEFQRWRREVATVVSRQLGNTPTLALNSYINPSVFGSWAKEGWL